MNEEKPDYMRREIDRKMIESMIASASLKEDLMELRMDIREMRKSIEGELDDIRKEQKILADARARLQVYVAIVAFLLAAWVAKIADKVF